MSTLLYKILFLLIKGLSVLPLRVLYLLSNLFFGLVYYVVRYRRKVVRRNLEQAFPTLDSYEHALVERVFYAHLCDMFVETVAMESMKVEEMRERMHFINPELPRSYLEQGRSVILCLGHAGNWEWVTSLALDYPAEEMVTGQIYRPLKNRFFDNYYLRIRQRWGSRCIAKNDTLREIVRLRAAKKPFMIGFMADQAPSKNNQHYWTNFLNQDSAILTGPEAIARKADLVVLYLDVQKVGRGYYEGEFSLITDRAKEEPEFAITERYARMMEETILNNPAAWLWSHKRWKHKQS